MRSCLGNISASESRSPAGQGMGQQEAAGLCLRPCSKTQVGVPASVSPASPGAGVGDGHLLQISSAASWLKSCCCRTLLRAWTAQSSRRCRSWYTEGGLG